MKSSSVMTILLLLAISTTAICQDDVNQSPNLEEKVSTASKAIIMLTRGRQLEGDFSSITSITAQTSFGDATFPIEKIEGIKLHADENDSCIFAFKNGDLVTGKLALDQIKLTTDWGDANINVSSIEVIKLNPMGEFFQDSTAGKARWLFGETREVRQQQQQRPNTQPSRNNLNQPGRTVIRNNRR